MRKTFKIVLLSCSMFVMTCTAHAESLFEALAYTYETNPTLEASRAYLRSVDERVGQAKAGWRPNLSAVGNAAYTDQRFKNYPGTDDFDYDNDAYDAGLSLTQPIFSGFKTVSGVNYAETIVKQERENLKSTEQAVLLNSAVAYVDVITQRAVLELQKNQEQVLARHLKSYQKRFEVGDLTKTDVAQSEARLEGAKTNRIVAEGDLETANAAYVSMVGRKPPEKTRVNDLDKFLPKTLSECLDIMRTNNPSLKAAEFADEASQYNITLQRGDLLPELNVNAGAGYQWGQPLPQLDDKYDGHYWQIGANLTVPLYQGGGEYAKVREAKQLANQARINLEQVKRDLVKSTTQAWEQYRSTKSSIESIEAQIKASKMALDGVIREADVGSRTVLDVLDAEQEYLNNRVQLVQAERNMTVAALNLLSAMGHMTAGSLKLNVAQYNPQDYYENVSSKLIGTGI